MDLKKCMFFFLFLDGVGVAGEGREEEGGVE